MTEETLKSHRKRVTISVNEKAELDLYLTPYTKINSR
jgi:hypothetical protein